VTHRWINEVGTKLDSTSDKQSQTHLQHRLCMLAATCFSTFDVCPEHIPSILAVEEDFSIAMQCAVIVHDNTPTSPSDDDSDSHYSTRMLSRHRRLLHNLEPILSQSLPPVRCRARLLHAKAYDHALARLWPGNRQDNSSNWHVVHKKNSRWISCVTSGGQEVHYDILTGELLIGGNPSGRLPQRIVEHATYKSIFGAVSDQVNVLAVSDLS
jgi:hypothetical protein